MLLVRMTGDVHTSKCMDVTCHWVTCLPKEEEPRLFFFSWYLTYSADFMMEGEQLPTGNELN